MQIFSNTCPSSYPALQVSPKPCCFTPLKGGFPFKAVDAIISGLLPSLCQITDHADIQYVRNAGLFYIEWNHLHNWPSDSASYFLWVGALLCHRLIWAYDVKVHCLTKECHISVASDLRLEAETISDRALSMVHSSEAADVLPLDVAVRSVQPALDLQMRRAKTSNVMLC